MDHCSRVEFYNTHSSVEIIPHLPLIKGGQIMTAVPWVCLPFVIVFFPDHTRLLYLVLEKAKT